MWKYLFPGNGMGNLFLQFLLYGACCAPFFWLGLPDLIAAIAGAVVRVAIAVGLAMLDVAKEEE